MTDNGYHPDDGELGSWIHNAGREALAPRAGHIDELREKLLARTTPTPGRQRPWPVLGPLLGAAAVAATLLFAVVALTTRPTTAWAQVVETAARRPWIHGVTTISDGQQERTYELWVSNVRRTSAFRFGDRVQLDDHQTDVSTQFDAAQGVIYRVPRLHLRRGLLGSEDGAGFFEQLLLNSEAAANAFPDDKVVSSQSKEVTADGRRWVDFTLKLCRRYEPITTREMVIRADADARLLHTWTVKYSTGLTTVTRFDYPDSGPADIYALGVPKSARIVDRIPHGDLSRIAKGTKAARQRFDDYDAIVVTCSEGSRTSLHDLMNLAVRRVRRKGQRLRVDMLLKASPGLRLPAAEEDMTKWWKANREHYVSVPMLICDGQTLFFYRMVDDRITAKQPPNTAVRLSQERPLFPPADDPPVEWPQLMPEQYSHPHLDFCRERDFAVNDSPDDGPQGTVRIVVTGPSHSAQPAQELHRYWIDPNLGYALRRSQSTVFDSKTKDVAFIDIVEFSDFARSPSGIAYPQLARRTTSGSDIVQLTSYHVDFDTKLADNLFEPVAVAAK